MRRAGRPPLSAASNIAIIAAPDLKAALIEVARVNNRSLSQEARARIERSFYTDEITIQLDRIEATLRRIAAP